MEVEVAQHLIQEGVESSSEKQTWADLGAGNGLFTRALSMLLPKGSTIYAVDSNRSSMNTIRVHPEIVLQKIHTDFVRENWSKDVHDGILMANALHFVKDKALFLKKLKEKLSPEGRLVIVEYEMEQGNAWVPYPIGFHKLLELARQSGFASVKKLKEVPSVYGNRMIYSAAVA